MTPLLDACEEHPTVFVIEQLIELGADVFVQDEVSQNVYSSLVLYSDLCRTNKMHCIRLQ